MENLDLKKSSPLLFISPFFLWGTAMVAMKGVIPHTTPLFMAGIRLVPAGMLVLIVAWFLGRPQPKTLQAWLWIALFALMDATLFQGFLALGLNRTGAGLGSVIIDSQPLAVALMSSWFYDFFGQKAVNIDFSWQELLNSGEMLMLLASLSMAVGTVLIRFVCRHADPVSATGWHMILGGLPLFLASGFRESHQWQNIDFNGWLALSYATIFGSAIAYGIFFYLAAKGNLTSLSSLTFLTPVFALTFGNLFLGEMLSVLQWVGVSLTLVSIYLINQRERIAPQLRAIFANLSSLIPKSN
jgi:drug/metabolite transporter (DMT)-like permease